MICMSLSAVVYAAGRSRPRTSCTWRTVLGPRSHKTRRMASSASVGRGVLDFDIGNLAARLSTNAFVMSTKNFVAGVAEDSRGGSEQRRQNPPEHEKLDGRRQRSVGL